MRILVGFLIVACVVGYFISHRQLEKTAEAVPASNATSPPIAAIPKAREHHWPKAAFDRVDDLKAQVAEHNKQTK